MKPNDLCIWLKAPLLYGPARFKGCTASGRMLLQWLDEHDEIEFSKMCDPQDVESYDRWIAEGGSSLTDEDLRGLAA